jgi:hypothetical protein
MRIVAWNCQMGFHKKVEAFSSHNSDLAVVSECSQDSALALRSRGFKTLWFGSNPRKGMVVLCREAWVASEGISVLTLNITVTTGCN